MPQLLSHLYIIFYFFKHFRVYVQEWNAWYILFLYSTAYTTAVFALYNIYFWFFLKLDIPPVLTYVSWVICFAAIFHGLMLSNIYYKAEDESQIWRIAYTYGLQKRIFLFEIWTYFYNYRAFWIYHHLIKQTETPHATLVWLIKIIIKTHAIWLFFLICTSLFMPEEVMWFVSNTASASYNSNNDIIYFYCAELLIIYLIFKYIFYIYADLGSADIYIPGVIYKHKLGYEPTIRMLRQDIINRNRWFAPATISRRFRYLYKYAPQYQYQKQFIIDKPVMTFNTDRYIAFNQAINHFYLSTKFIKNYAPLLTNFHNEQKTPPIFIY